MKTTIARLKYAMKKREADWGRKIFKKELAKAAEVTSAAVSFWWSNEDTDLESKCVFGLAKFLQISPEWLQSGRGGMDAPVERKHSSADAEKSNKSQISGMITDSSHITDDMIGGNNTEPGPDIRGKIPLISWVQAGAWESIVDNFAPGDAEQWLDSPINVSSSSYYLRVRGESMFDPADHRSFREGELALVDPNAQAEHKSLVVVRLDDEAEATFKQLILEGGKKYLKALNPNWPNRIFEVNGNATICGVVKGKFVDGY
jgi:SOS-response transcriptional repressor LexA